MILVPSALGVGLLVSGQAEPRPPAGTVLGAIRGRVEIRGGASVVEPRPLVGDLGMPAVPDTPNRRRAVVYLEEAPRGAFEDQDAPTTVLDQRNETFVPYVVPIQVGTTVRFLNSDRTYHNVFSFSKVKRFDLGRYAKGQSKAVRFDRPGVVRVFCEIHSHMSAYVLVFAHRFFGATNDEGRYRIDRVPAGTYTVKAWVDGQVRESRSVRVPEGGGFVEADFALP